VYGRVHCCYTQLGKCTHSCTEQIYTHFYGIQQIMYTQLDPDTEQMYTLLYWRRANVHTAEQMCIHGTDFLAIAAESSELDRLRCTGSAERRAMRFYNV
jgi:hypothetical protein